MLGKKGGFGLPLYFPQTLLLFVLTLIFFGVLFLVIGISQNPNLLINGAAYQDSHRLLTILQSPMQLNNEKITLAEFISIAYEDENYKTKLEEELTSLLNSLPKPGIRQDYWNMDIEIDNKEFVSLGDKTIGAQNYYEQQVNIPLSNNKIAKVKLYLNCLSCTRGDLDNFA